MLGADADVAAGGGKERAKNSWKQGKNSKQLAESPVNGVPEERRNRCVAWFARCVPDGRGEKTRRCGPG